MVYFGFFKGMTYGKCYDDFEEYKQIHNELPKDIILVYLKSLPIAAVAPMLTQDMFTGEYLEMAGLYEDGEFCFPLDFIHYYEKYEIGIPLVYEEYLKTRIKDINNNE